MNVLIGCEFSGIVREAFRERGHNAYSCDLLPTERPSKYHYQENVLDVVSKRPWDLFIAHPPCTYLSYAATRSWNNPGRAELREHALQFFLAVYHAPVNMVAIENPVGYPNTVFRKPDQIFHPYYFGDPFKKRTCLWLRGLPKLIYMSNLVEPPPVAFYKKGKSKGKAIHWSGAMPPGPNRAHNRSRTFLGLATAMAEQWGSL